MRAGIGAGELLPEFGGGGRPQRLGNVPLPFSARGIAQHRDLLAGNANAIQQRLHGKLRMTERRRDKLIASNRPPGLVVEPQVEAGQHHGAVRQPGDRGDQLGGRGHRAG